MKRKSGWLTRSVNYHMAKLRRNGTYVPAGTEGALRAMYRAGRLWQRNHEKETK